MNDTHIGHLSRLTLASDALTTEVQIFKPGRFRKGGKWFEFGAKQAEEAVKNFNAKVAGEPPLDFDHEFAYGGSSQAAGWFKTLYEKDGALWATVELTKDAAQKVRDGVYRFFSPEFAGEYVDEHNKRHGFAIVAGGLTNRPFLKNMAPITLADDITLGELDCDFQIVASERGREMAILNGKGKNDGGAEPTIETLTARVAELEPLAEQVTTLTTERDDLATKLKGAEAGKTDAEKGVEKLTARLDDMQKEHFTEKRDACIAKHRKRGAIDATDETTKKWHERAEKIGVDGIDELLSEIPDEKAVPLSERGHGNDKPGTAKAPDGVDPTAFALDVRAKDIIAERKKEGATISYSEAVFAAEAEIEVAA